MNWNLRAKVNLPPYKIIISGILPQSQKPACAHRFRGLIAKGKLGPLERSKILSYFTLAWALEMGGGDLNRLSVELCTLGCLFGLGQPIQGEWGLVRVEVRNLLICKIMRFQLQLVPFGKGPAFLISKECPSQPRRAPSPPPLSPHPSFSLPHLATLSY